MFFYSARIRSTFFAIKLTTPFWIGFDVEKKGFRQRQLQQPRQHGSTSSCKQWLSNGGSGLSLGSDARELSSYIGGEARPLGEDKRGCKRRSEDVKGGTRMKEGERGRWVGGRGRLGEGEQ